MTYPTEYNASMSTLITNSLCWGNFLLRPATPIVILFMHHQPAILLKTVCDGKEKSAVIHLQAGSVRTGVAKVSARLLDTLAERLLSLTHPYTGVVVLQ